MVDGAQFVGAHFEVAEPALFDAQLHAIPIAPRFAGDHRNLFRRRDLAQPAEFFLENRSFERKLIVILGVLVVAAAASSEYRARRGYTAGRRLQDFHCTGVDQAGLFALCPHSNQLSRQHEWCEHHAAIQARQSVAAVYQLLHSHFKIAYDKSYPRPLP